MRILLAGATGTAGGAVLDALVAAGHTVVALSRNQEPSCDTATWLPWSAIQQTSHPSLTGIDAVVSCLASRTGGIRDSHAVEYQANSELLAFAMRHNISRFMLLSAICVQKPRLAFQHAKLAFEQELISSGIDWQIVRPTAFFKSLSGQIGRIQKGKPFLVFGNGLLTACKPISQQDLARFMCRELERDEHINCILPIGGPGPAITPLDQVRLLEMAFKRPVAIKSVSPSLFRLAERLFGLFAPLSNWFADKAEFCRIAHFYATESMLVWDSEQDRYDSAATPETGSDTLSDFYCAIAAGEAAPPERRKHKLFS